MTTTNSNYFTTNSFSYNPPPPIITIPPLSNRYPYQEYQEQPPPGTPRSIKVGKWVGIAIIICLGAAMYTSFAMYAYSQNSPGPKVSVESLSLSNYNSNFSSGSNNRRLITGTWDARFRFHNPNKKSAPTSFYDVVSYVIYKKQILARALIPPVFVGMGVNDTTVEVGFTAVDLVVEAMDADRIKHGLVKFDVRIMVTWKRGEMMYGDVARCKGVTVSGSAGNMVGRPRTCKWKYDWPV